VKYKSGQLSLLKSATDTQAPSAPTCAAMFAILGSSVVSWWTKSMPLSCETSLNWMPARPAILPAARPFNARTAPIAATNAAVTMKRRQDMA